MLDRKVALTEGGDVTVDTPTQMDVNAPTTGWTGDLNLNWRCPNDWCSYSIRFS